MRIRQSCCSSEAQQQVAKDAAKSERGNAGIDLAEGGEPLLLGEDN